MSIKPLCCMCGFELKQFGALLFSLPDKKNWVKKHHICAKCYKKIERNLKC
jgi:hypothetical protein